jgi:hypothetical protein
MEINQAVLKVDMCREMLETGYTCITYGEGWIYWSNQKRVRKSILPHEDDTATRETATLRRKERHFCV